MEVKTAGESWKARVLDSGRKGLGVHCYGYETADDEWVEIKRMKPR